MNRIDRLHAILTVLQSKRIVRAEDLAQRFDISIRTVYRDLKALEEGGVPIGAEAGVGYFLSEGYHIPPVMFTIEEARSLMVAGKFLEHYTDQSIIRNYQGALTKIQAVLDMDKKDDLESLDKKILISPFGFNRPKSEDLHLEQLKESLAKNKTIQIKYVSGSGEESERVVEPLGITYYGSNWHLIGFCRTRKDYRDFRLDRIYAIQVLQEKFLRIKHPELKEYMEKYMSESELLEIVLEIPEYIMKYIDGVKYSMGLMEEVKLTEGYRITFVTHSLDYFMRWVIMLGPKTKIVSPSGVKEKLFEILDQWKREPNS